MNAAQPVEPEETQPPVKPVAVDPVPQDDLPSVGKPVKKVAKKAPAKKAAAKKTPAKKAAEKPAKKAAAPRTKARGQNRASGLPPGIEEGQKSMDEAESPPEDDVLPEERAEWWKSPGFQRMRTEWTGDDKRVMDRIQALIARRLFDAFPEAYGIMEEIYELVREPAVNLATGEITRDPYGFVVWQRNPLTNQPIEDWTKLTNNQRENFLFQITTQLFEWEQRAADLWTSAMFSKGMFVEKFSIEYDAPMAGTIDDRNARGNKEAAEERYFALMNSALSKKADALVRTMTNLQLRLKDVLGSA